MSLILKIKFIYFEHHFDLMINKGYKFNDINRLLTSNNFQRKYKIRMKFRKSFEYIYENSKNKIIASVIIVNFNNAKYLSKSIDSVLSQTINQKKEIIVVDDNSSDNSIKVLNKYKDKIKIIRNKKKTKFGSYNQMNCYYKGLLKSKGDYLFFLDSDYFFKKEKIKIIINEFIINKKLNVLFDLPIWKYNLKLVKKNLDKKIYFIKLAKI